MCRRNKKDLRKPICRTEDKALGKCMPLDKALEIIKEHEKSNPDHVVDLLKC
jgi:hypothetical protein